MSCTLKDIARLAGVSSVTVHKCIYGKPGVSEQTRRRVLSIVEAQRYSVNTAASSLKRETLAIAVISPSLEEPLNYFFRAVDEGVREAAAYLHDFNTEVRCFHCGDTWESQAVILDELYARSDIHGIVIYCINSLRLNEHFERFRQRGIPVITFHSDAENSCRVGSVVAPDVRTGRMVAEFLSHIVGRGKRVLVVGGNKMLKVLSDTTLGFFTYMQEKRPDLIACEISYSETLEGLRGEVVNQLSAFPDYGGVYVISARNGVPVCEAVRSLGLGGKVALVLSDVFEAIRPYFDEGIATATVWQNPQAQSRTAIVSMYQYLVGQKLPAEVQHVRACLVLRNNFDDYL